MSKPAPKRFLFVCTGNTCRSPLAQALLARAAAAAGLPWTAASAGLAAYEGAPLSAGAARALAARGLPPLAHSARPVDLEAVGSADAVFGLAREHVESLKARYPQAAGKIKLLREEAGLRPVDVKDPVGGDDAAYEAAAAAIEEALKILVERERHAPNHR